MRNKLLYLVLPFFMLSCNEWLNVEPEDEISEEKLFSTGTGFRHALNGVYFTMESRNLYGKHLTWGIVDALGQVYDYKKAPGVNEMEYGAAKYAWDYYEFKPVLSSIWTEAYNVVANCNNIIQQIEYADPEIFAWKENEKAMIWGEALALRAFIQFDMLRLFAPAPSTNPGDRKFIPYVNTYPSYISNPKTVNECLELIAKDLIDAKQLLWKYDSAGSFSRSNNFELAGSGEKIFLIRRGFHLNYWAATALLARVYLQMQNYDEALRYANLALEQNNQLFDWNAFYEEHQAAIDDPDNYDKIVTPMQYDYVENYYLRYGVQSNFDSYEYNIPVERAERFEEGDARFLSRWKLKVDNNDTYYKALEPMVHILLH